MSTNSEVRAVAINHATTQLHDTHFRANFGWVCEQCDPDWRELLAEYNITPDEHYPLHFSTGMLASLDHALNKLHQHQTEEIS